LKKFLILFSAVLLIIFSAGSGYTKPVAEEFRNKDYDYRSIKTVLRMPVFYDIQIPASEAFFDEAVQQKWAGLTEQGKNNLPFLIKTPDQVIERDNFVRGVQPSERLSPNKAAERAISLSPEYVDAVMTATVTKCGYETVHHPEEMTWQTRYENRPVLVNGKWESCSVPVRYQQIKPEWDEKFACGTVKIELRTSKENALVYGISVTARTGEDPFTPLPSLTKHICNILENAVKRIPQK